MESNTCSISVCNHYSVYSTWSLKWVGAQEKWNETMLFTALFLVFHMGWGVEAIEYPQKEEQCRQILMVYAWMPSEFLILLFM